MISNPPLIVCLLADPSFFLVEESLGSPIWSAVSVWLGTPIAMMFTMFWSNWSVNCWSFMTCRTSWLFGWTMGVFSVYSWLIIDFLRPAEAFIREESWRGNWDLVLSSPNKEEFLFSFLNNSSWLESLLPAGASGACLTERYSSYFLLISTCNYWTLFTRSYASWLTCWGLAIMRIYPDMKLELISVWKPGEGLWLNCKGTFNLPLSWPDSAYWWACPSTWEMSGSAGDSTLFSCSFWMEPELVNLLSLMNTLPGPGLLLPPTVLGAPPIPLSIKFIKEPLLPISFVLFMEVCPNCYLSLNVFIR